MKKNYSKNKRIIITLLLFLQATFIFAETYYVSPLGNNGNSGTSEAQAFKTIQRAINKMRSGDILIVLDGVYSEELQLKSGITIKAQNPRRAIISGAKIVSGFENHDQNIYKTAVGDTVYNVFFGQNPMTWARWPNTEWKNNWRTNQKWESVTDAGPGTESDGTGFVTADFADVANKNLVGGYCFIRYGKGNSCYSRKIESFGGGTLLWNDDLFYDNYYTGEDGWRGAVGHGLSTSHAWHPNKSEFFLAGDIDLLDNPGEWFEEDGTLYFYPPSGTPADQVVYAQTTTAIIHETEPISDLTINGVDFFAGGVLLESMENSDITFNNVQFNYIGGELLWVNRREGWATEKPVRINGSRLTVNQCLFAGAKNSALNMDGSEIIIKNSIFMEGNRNANFESRPIMMTASGMYTVSNNTIFNNASDAIRIVLDRELFDPSITPEIAHNNIFNAGRFNSDVSGIYLPILDQYHTEIHHNWMHNVNGNALRLDLAGANLTVHHNVFWNSHRGMNIEGYFGFNIYNNTGFGNDINSFTQNQFNHFEGYEFGEEDRSYPPIDDWNIVNNLLQKIEDRAFGPRESTTFNQSKNQNLLDPIRKADNNILLGSDYGKIVGNMTNKSGYNTSYFTSTNGASLNLVPDNIAVANGAIQTATMVADGVTSLDTFRGAYAPNDPAPWSAGSDWMPNGLTVLNTMASSESFASASDLVSYVPRVANIEVVTPETVSLTNGSFEIDDVGLKTGNEITGWEINATNGAAGTFQVNGNNSVDGDQSFRCIVQNVDDPNKPWGMELVNSDDNFLAFGAGDEVSISFYAKAGVAGQAMRLKFRDGDNGNATTGDYTLGTEFEEYTLNVQVPESRTDYRTSFFLGYATGAIWIDNINIVVIRAVTEIANGSFEIDDIGFKTGNQITGWKVSETQGATGTFQVNSNNSVDGSQSFRCVVQNVNDPDKPWGVLLDTNEENLLAFEAGDNVSISFYAKAITSGQELRLKFRDSDNGNGVKGDYILGTEFEKYTLNVQVAESRTDYRTSFFLGHSAGAIWIDKIEVNYLGSSALKAFLPSIEEPFVQEGETLRIYPNPVADYLTVILPEEEEIESLYIADMSGKSLLKVNDLIGRSSYQIDMTPYGAGLYFISTQSISGELKSYKVLVK